MKLISCMHVDIYIHIYIYIYIYIYMMYGCWLTSAFMAPALKLWWYWGLFSRAKYTRVGKGCPSISTAMGSFPLISIYELKIIVTILLSKQEN
jgi:hypothetical protein